MLAAGIKPADLARRSHVTRGTVSLWMSGATKSIEGENLTRAAEVLAVSPHWLATGEGLRDPRGRSQIAAAETRADYNSPVDPQDFAKIKTAWARMDKRSREHLLAIAMALAENKKR